MIFLLFCSLHVFLSNLSIFVHTLPLNLIDFHLTPISHLKISPFIETFQAVYFNETELKNAILSKQNPVRIKFEKIDDRSYQFDLWLDTSFYDSNSLVVEIVGNRSSASSVVDGFNYFYTGHEVGNEQVTIVGSVSTDSWLFEGEISKFNGHQKIILESLSNYDVNERLVTRNLPIDFKLIFYFETDVRRNWFKRNESSRYRRWMLPPISYDEDESWLPPNVLHQPVDTTIVFNDENRSSKNSIKNYLTYKHRNRLDVNKKKTTCFLYLQADHLLFEKLGTKKAVVETLMRHVQRLNYIYNDIDFDADGNPDKINFIVKRIKVYSSDALKDPAYRFAPDSFTVEKYLEAFSEENYDSFCLVYMFTYRDFEMGTLGLAWTGDIRNAGGVCERYGHYRGSMKSLNTGIVTLLNYGKFVPSLISHITFAHEIGHNFGSPHDPPHCVPGGKNGNFIMYSRATPGNKKNNYQFSQCSIASINSVLNLKARSHWFGCFQESPKSLCGNGIVEGDEECDCGWEDDCKESCCFPQRVSAVLNEQPCKLKPNKLCSPSQGACCDSECRFKYAEKCRDENNCRSASYCDGWTAKCPGATHKPNHTKCAANSVCFMGECTSSICFAFGLESCQCNKTEQLCHLCCKLPGPNATCQSTFEWSAIDSQISLPKTKAKRGAICNNYRGYCDNYGNCRDIDPTGPLLAIKNLLFSNDLFLKILLLTTVFTIVIFVLVLLLCSSNSRKSDRKRSQKPSATVNKSHAKRQKKQSVSKISAKIKSKVLNVSTQQQQTGPNPQNQKNSRSQKDKSNPSTKKISSRIKTHKTDQPQSLTAADHHHVVVTAKATAKQSKSNSRKNKKSSKSIAAKKQQSFEIDTEISKKVGNWLSESQKELNSSKTQRTAGCDLSVAKANTSEIVPQSSDDINSNLDTVQSDLDVLISKC